MLLRRTALAALLSTLYFQAAAQTDPRARAACAEAGTIARELTEISGMKLRHRVPCDFITKEEVNEFLKKRVKEAAKPEDIRAEELTLKKFGLVPQDFDLAKTTIELLTEQAAAFYDYDRKKLFITDTTPSATQAPVLAHELAHALADQSFRLDRFIKQGQKSDDGSAARLAVMEGQATWIMTEYLARKMGRSLKDSPELAAAMSSLTESSGGQFPVFDNSPLYLRKTLVFPYVKGMMFQDAVVRRSGIAGFAEVFRDPPVSTQQIAHPEKYFAGVRPTEPTLPDPKLPSGYKSLVGGSLGELEHAILIEQYAGKSEAEELAPHWRGCSFELLENRKAGRVVLLFATEWDGPEWAERFFRIYQKGLAKKWKRYEPGKTEAESVEGYGDDGRFELRLKGALVTGMEGLPPELH